MALTLGQAKTRLRGHPPRNRFTLNSNPLRADPTRTVTIRRRFIGDLNRRFRKLKIHLYTFLVKDDALGLKEKKLGFTLNARPREFEFQTDENKLKAFQEWFAQQVEEDVFSVPPGTPFGRPWVAEYVISAYKMGLLNAYLSSKNRIENEGLASLARDQFLRDAFAQPETMSKVLLLATRSFESLKGVTATMAGEMNRILSKGIINGSNVTSIAREMTERIDGLAYSRALAIARTEVIYAHAEGQLDSFERLGVEELGVKAEWSTAGDDRVCPQCADYEGKVYTVDEAHGLIPLHPNCVLGDSFVETGDALALMRVKYFGPIIRILTSSGGIVSVTENHVMATLGGWTKAKCICKGDQLVRASSVGFPSFETPNDNQSKFEIQYVFDFLSKSFPEQFGFVTRTSPENFHGDGRNIKKQIDIIFSDCKLRNGLHPSLLEKAEKFSFVMGHIGTFQALSFSRFRTASLLLHRHHTSPYSDMGRDNISCVLCGRSFIHHKPVGFGVSSDAHSSMFQSGGNTGSGAFKPFGDLLYRIPGQVKLDKVIDVQVMKPVDTGVFAFDVWTHSLSYSLNGLLSTNCRCSWIPFIPEK